MLKHMWRTFWLTWYSDKLAQVSEQRFYLVAQSNDAHRYLDSRERALKAKVMQLQMDCEGTA